MNLTEKANELWEDPQGGLLLLLILYLPAPAIYFGLDNTWSESATYTTVWSFLLTGFFWTVIYWIDGKFNDEEEVVDDARH